MPHASSLRSRIAASTAALGLLLGLGCSGKKKAAAPVVHTLATLKGKITYVRIPLLKDSTGVPIGLETNPANFQTLPARGVAVQAFRLDPTSSQWRLEQTTFSDSNGNYSMVVLAGDDYEVQVEGLVQFQGLYPITLVADPNGLSSTLPQAQRSRYFLRSSADGTPATPSNLLPVSNVKGDSTHTANFTVDLSTSWMIGSLETSIDRSIPSYPSATFESGPTGSRILAILDSIYAFGTVYGNPTPAAPLDLHYLVGRSETKGTYIEYDLQHWAQPGGVDLAYDSLQGVDHYFGSIRGASSNDDAWDQSVLYRLLGKANLVGQQLTNSISSTYPFNLSPLESPIDGLSPDQAMIEGLPDAMAANLLQSPYLADTDGTSSLLSLSDVRDFSSVSPSDVGAYSPKSLAAMIWEIGLKAEGVISPGNASNWSTIDPHAIGRIFRFSMPSGYFTPPNIYSQVALLKQQKTPSEPVDLAAIFTDTVINGITSPFNLPWPQPSSTTFGQAWTSTTGGTYAFSGTLSMSKDPLVGGVYPNESYLELAYLGISQTNDQTYQLSLQTTPASLPAGATIQVVVFSGAATQAYTFSGSTASPITFTLAGNGSTTSPVPYPIRVRLLSPTTLQPDIPFTLTVAPAPPGTLRGPVLHP